MRRPYYGWIVTVACFCLMLTYGFIFSFGVFLDPIIEEFGWSNVVTSGVYSTYWVFFTLSALLMGTLADRYSPRLILSASAFLVGLGMAFSASASAVWHLYVSFGVIGGIGAGGLWVPAMTVTMRWFKEEGALSWAVGLVALGSAVGMILVAPLEGLVVPIFGWRAGYYFIAFFIWGITFASSILVRNPRKVTVTQPNSRSNFTDLVGLMRTRPFLCLFVAYGLGGGWARQDLLVHVVSFLGTREFAYAVGVLSLFMVGVGSAFGRLLIGALEKSMNEKVMLFLFFLLQGLSIFLLLVFHDLNSAYSSSFLFGIAYGGAVCAFPLIVAKVFGTSHFGVIYGLLTIGTGMGAVLGPILGGYLFDLTRTYSNSFLTDVLVSLIGAGFLLLFRLRDTLYTSRLD